MRIVLFVLAIAAGAAAYLELLQVAFVEDAIPGVILGVAAAQFLAMALMPNGGSRRIGKGTIGQRAFVAYADGTIAVTYGKDEVITFPSLSVAERIAQEEAIGARRSTDIPISYGRFGRTS